MIQTKYLIPLVFNLVYWVVCNSQEVFYLDSNYPGLEPIIYSPDILSLPGRYEHGLTIIHNGLEHIFGLDGKKNWTYNGLASLKKDNGEWTDGVNMGPEINTEGFELAPYISPDNKYLFFTRRDKYNDAYSSDIFWVSLDIASKIKSTIKNKSE